MASSSSSARSLQLPQWKYDVFLSFRGEDTRKTFTGYLYEGLKNRGIITFQDEKRLEHGDSISEELLKAIEESQVAIIVFSKNYATSRWCLDELIKIMECKDKNGQTVVPIFYDVDPSHVRYQSVSFAEAFAKHDLRYKDDEGMQKVQGWRTALTAAANLKGFDIHDGIEAEHIQQIVDHVSSKLRKSANSLSSLQDIVGINAHLEKLESLLHIEINDVRFVGIWGIGGVGKTTIAKAIFDTLSYHFKAACFLADIKEKAKNNQLHTIQNNLLSDLLRKKDDYVNNKYDGKGMIPSRLCSMKVLIVLDDIDHSDHLEYLAGDVSWFGNGSRVIVTTRNRHLIGKDDAIHQVPTLPDQEAMQLFNRHAFRKEVPDECFKMLSLEVVDHAKGLPLALKVWGSLLYKKGLTQWRRTVDQIKKNSSTEIVEKLKISYDGLEPEEQKIFLDVACFFRGYKKDEVVQILESCDFGAEYGLDVLIDKSLVFISEYYTIQMHDLIQVMGRYVIKMQKDSGGLSRIWNAKDFEEIMLNNTGSMAVEAIWLPYLDQLSFNKEAMKNMTRLRILNISSSNWDDGPIEFFSNNLRHLGLARSSLHHLWNETKVLPCLKTLDLRQSERLIETPDFTNMQNLEYLYLSQCRSLEEVHPSLRCCRKLKRLHLDYCESLVRFSYVNVESLEELYINYCSRLEKIPQMLGIRKPKLEIQMGDSGIRELPSSFFQHQTHLTKLDVSRCRKLETLPVEIGDLENLEKLYARNTLISQPPSSIVRLNKLKVLNFSKDDDSENFVFPQLNGGLRSLEILILRGCNLIDGGLPEDIGCLSSLEFLDLSENNFEHLPRSIAQLGALQSLELSYCKRLKELPDFTNMQNLEHLYLSHCRSLEEVHPSLRCCRKLTWLILAYCESLVRFSYVNVESLEYLNLNDCSRLDKFPEILGIMKPKLKIQMGGCGFFKR